MRIFIWINKWYFGSEIFALKKALQKKSLDTIHCRSYICPFPYSQSTKILRFFITSLEVYAVFLTHQNKSLLGYIIGHFPYSILKIVCVYSLSFIYMPFSIQKFVQKYIFSPHLFRGIYRFRYSSKKIDTAYI